MTSTALPLPFPPSGRAINAVDAPFAVLRSNDPVLMRLDRAAHLVTPRRGRRAINPLFYIFKLPAAALENCVVTELDTVYVDLFVKDGSGGVLETIGTDRGAWPE